MIYKVTTNSATIKNQPLYTAPIIGRFEINTEIDVLEVSKKWATIIYEGNHAYISTMYIKSIEVPTTTEESTENIEEVAAPTKEESEVVVESPTTTEEPTANVDDVSVPAKEESEVVVELPTTSEEPAEYTSIKGTVTIKYIDYDDKVEMHPDRVYTDLDLNTYAFDAKPISGYFNLGACYENITLNESEYEKTITFYYKKRLGSVTVRYIDAITKKEIESYEIFNNLVFDEYIYEAKEIKGYNVVGEHSKIVSIDDTLTNCELYFEYKLSKDN